MNQHTAITDLAEAFASLAEELHAFSGCPLPFEQCAETDELAEEVSSN